MRAHNSYVTQQRSYDAVRKETVQAAVNFLELRLHEEQEETVNTVIRLTNASTLADFIETGTSVVHGLFGEESVEKFCENICDTWPVLSAARNSVHTMREKLWALHGAATGETKKLFGAFLSLIPHSMATERTVSHFNTIKSPHRMSMKGDTVNDRLVIAINGVGTVNFDPRPAVARFLTKRQRRQRTPNNDSYQNREFVKKFFREDGGI